MPLLNLYLANRRKRLHKPEPLTVNEKKIIKIGIIGISLVVFNILVLLAIFVWEIF